jgi:pilus assembly protein CpaC
MPSNSNHAMSNPGPDVTGAKPLPDATPTMPVEKLIESMQPEQPLVIDTNMTQGGYGGQGASTGATSSPPAAPQ